MPATHCEVCSSSTENGSPCANCGYSAATDYLPQAARPRTPRGLHTTTGTVDTPAQCELRRPYLATAVSIASATALVATYLGAPVHPLTHQLQMWMTGVLAAAAAIVLTALQPLLEYVLLIVFIAIGLRMVLMPVLGPPRLRPGGLVGRLLAAAGDLAGRAVVAAFHLTVRLIHLALGHLLRPTPRLTFTLTGSDNQQYRIRISRTQLALHPGEQISVTGLTLAGTTHAYRLYSPGSPARYPRPGLAEITALVLTAAALTALAGTR